MENLSKYDYWYNRILNIYLERTYFYLNYKLFKISHEILENHQTLAKILAKNSFSHRKNLYHGIAPKKDFWITKKRGENLEKYFLILKIWSITFDFEQRLLKNYFEHMHSVKVLKTYNFENLFLQLKIWSITFDFEQLLPKNYF